MSQQAAEWEERHPKTSNGVPSRLYTDENPATTIKGLGYRNRSVAERTVRLTSQAGVRYKQYWTIKAMRERAQHHAHPTKDMQEAIQVFDQWLVNYKPPNPAEKKKQENEWREYRRLCQTTSNRHAYGNDPTKDELDRARKDLQCARNGLLAGIRFAQQRRTSSQTGIPITAFTALFGGPGLHGYGSHKVRGHESYVVINGKEGLEELLPKTSKTQLSPTEGLQSLDVTYNLHHQTARFQLKFRENRTTLKTLWNNLPKASPKTSSGDRYADEANSGKEPVWSCSACTFEHSGKAKHMYLACELCGTSRSAANNKATTTKMGGTKAPTTSAAPTQSTPVKESPSLKSNATTNTKRPAQGLAWGSLRPPSQKDIRGRYKRQKALDAPPPSLDHIVVLDFEWTADNKKKIEPIPEITQFPSVVMKLVQKKKGFPLQAPPQSNAGKIPLPLDLTVPSTEGFQRDAFAISAFDTFVRPTFNPKLTDFSIELTSITQADVNAAPTMELALQNYVAWLRTLDLVDSNGNRKGNWCFATWSDADIDVLRQELQYKSIALPPCFDKWINLKSDSMFKKHYGREPRGGLRNCVESLGAVWEGRAHNGLVDSINTAKIVRHMAQTGFRFVRSTRGLGKDGVPFGQKK